MSLVMSVPLSGLHGSDCKTQIVAVNEFRATLEAAEPQTCSSMQLEAIQPLLQLLKNTEVTLSNLSMENQLRLAILETLHRFQLNESFKPAINDVMRTILDILQNDNEEVACLSLKLFIDMHKAYKTGIEEFVQPFLDIVLKMYQNMSETVRASFEGIVAAIPSSRSAQNAASHSPMSPSATGELESASLINKPLHKSTHSFKVLTECPIIIVLLFSTYRQSVQTNLIQFTPAIIEMLSLQAPVSMESIKGFSLVSQARKQLLSDLMLAQIKTLSFLAYVLRGFTTFMKKYAQVIPQFVLRLLHDCPAEMSAARKVPRSHGRAMPSLTLVGIARRNPSYTIYRVPHFIRGKD